MYKRQPYGSTLIPNATGTQALEDSAYGNSYTFTGRQFDKETGLMYFRARYYDTSTGEFISRDPLGYIDGMSLYRGYFVPGGVDPSGNISQHDFVWDTTYSFEHVEIHSGDGMTEKTFMTVPTIGKVDENWTKASATATTQQGIDAMKREGNNFSANVFKAWMSGAQSFTPSATDKQEVMTKSGKLVKQMVRSYVKEQYSGLSESCPQNVDIDLKSEAYGGTYPRAHFDYPPIYLHKDSFSRDAKNLDLFIAFGGAGYDITGTGNLIDENRCGCRYAFKLDVAFSDNFKFDNGDGLFSLLRRGNKYYNAGYFLETIDKSAKPVEYEIGFPLRLLERIGL